MYSHLHSKEAIKITTIKRAAIKIAAINNNLTSAPTELLAADSRNPFTGHYTLLMLESKTAQASAEYRTPSEN